MSTLQPTLLDPYVMYRFPNMHGYRRNELFEAYCCHYLTPSVCAHLVDEALMHAERHGWDTRRHSAHPTTDLELLKITSLEQWARQQLSDTILPTMAFSYNFATSELSIEDMFFVKYEACDDAEAAETAEVEPSMGAIEAGCRDRLGIHRDGSLLSFSILLSDPLTFNGGGTRIAQLPKPRNQFQNQM